MGNKLAPAQETQRIWPICDLWIK